MKISDIIASQILDSRGNPTLKVIMHSSLGAVASFGVPTGASRGTRETVDLRDGTKEYGGLGVTRAVGLINEQLKPHLLGYDLGKQSSLDKVLIELDSSPQKSELGGNTTIGLSGAYLKLSAAEQKIPLWQYIAAQTSSTAALPRIFANLINGGKHAPGLAIQEFMIVPRNTSPSAAIAQIWQIDASLTAMLEQKYGAVIRLKGDEGGSAPMGASSSEVLDMCHAQMLAHGEVDIALGMAASTFYNDGKYNFEGTMYDPNQFVQLVKNWVEQYQVFSIEDPAAEEDEASFTAIKAAVAPALVVGDDIICTNAGRIEEMVQKDALGGVIIKPNQVGTFTETFDAVAIAKKAGLKVIVSHRSGETNDASIVDLAVGVGADGIKIGAPHHGERVAKYNRLLEIESAIIKARG